MADKGGSTPNPEIPFDPHPNDPEGVRLLDALHEANGKLKRIGGKPELKACQACFDRALAEAKDRPYVAWGALHEFDWEFLAALSPGEQQAQWRMLKAEADEKLTGWRYKAALSLAEQAGRADAPLHVIRQLQRNLTANAQNQQHKLEIFRRQTIPWVSMLLALAVVTVASVTSVLWYLRAGEPLGVWAQTLWLGMAAGALGAIVSTAFSAGRMNLKSKIPDLRLTDIVTYTRPLLGATVAIVIAILVKAEYVTIGSLQGNTGVIAACFVGGLSERWFLGLMEGLGGKT